MKTQRKGVSYRLRVQEVNRIYDEHARSGLSNRAIWLRYVYPRFGISERTFYNLLKAPLKETATADYFQLSLFPEDNHEGH